MLIKGVFILLILLGCKDELKFDLSAPSTYEHFEKIEKKLNTNAPLDERDLNLIFLYTKNYTKLKVPKPSGEQLARLIIYSNEKDLILSYMQLVVRAPKKELKKGATMIKKQKSGVYMALLRRFSKAEIKELD